MSEIFFENVRQLIIYDIGGERRASGMANIMRYDLDHMIVDFHGK